MTTRKAAAKAKPPAPKAAAPAGKPRAAKAKPPALALDLASDRGIVAAPKTPRKRKAKPPAAVEAKPEAGPPPAAVEAAAPTPPTGVSPACPYTIPGAEAGSRVTCVRPAKHAGRHASAPRTDGPDEGKPIHWEDRRKPAPPTPNMPSVIDAERWCGDVRIRMGRDGSHVVARLALMRTGDAGEAPGSLCETFRIGMPPVDGIYRLPSGDVAARGDLSPYFDLAAERAVETCIEETRARPDAIPTGRAFEEEGCAAWAAWEAWTDAVSVLPSADPNAEDRYKITPTHGEVTADE